MIDVVPLTPDRLAAWAALFEASCSPCFCHYWHFEGTKNEWLDRCARAPEENSADQARRVSSGDPAARGLLAMEGETAIGWLKLAPRETLPKLRRLSVYRQLDLGDGDGVYSIGCFLVHPEHRNRGVARALVDAAEGIVRAWGGRTIEAYPRRTDDPLHAEEAWMGPEALFVACGFRAFHDVGPYPVYRKTVAQVAEPDRGG